MQCILRGVTRVEPRRYHHGDLREALVSEGARIVARRGAGALSLRALARRIGVSPRAPYRHFADKEALLAAIAEQGFGRFGAALAAALGGHAGAPADERLRVLAAAYLEFSVTHAHLVELMFGDKFPNRARRHPALHRAALATFAALEAEVGRVIPGPSRRERALAATAAWALVHGLTDLVRKQQLEHVLPRAGDRGRLPRFVVDLFVRGASRR
jgi:AcrR family transcriptional regulator